MATFDPVPDPLRAGWIKEGTGTFQTGIRLIMRDSSTAAGDFVNFHCADDALFQGEVVLTPRLSVDAGFGAANDNNVGVHVTISDGAKEIRAVLLKAGASALRVAIVTPVGFSEGFTFSGLVVDFGLRRLADGTAVLSVANPTAGLPALEERISPVDLPGTMRQGKCVEFGTYDVPGAASTTNWETLGLPANADFPIGLSLRQIRIRDDNNDKLRLRANFTLAPGSDDIDPAVDGVKLRLSTPAGQFYPAGVDPLQINPGEFEFRDNQRPRRWKLSDAARQRTGVERFEILEDDGSIFFVDRRTNLATASYANVTVQFESGNDRGSGAAVLEERPAGSGRWRLDR
jgi:hypothetical protein